ncbi:D-alanyl-D-alanine carboxypeptidase/D-alanyl-D-alanine-endopeptidase [Streptomyces actinomycinicus]|uniref:D-alanyl-D-alanine carboxypeptidase/D-alanyl-D-alanine-endopeptidase n=1 Tax=Streptomyces actinomycinicus TaxID=1695166 RepID=A0A937EPF4_9ACTN|nr:D-alanyl-D-alanine carboxypeptidase/D-alanyl-D-alanine-endopeptidase [Streptomyces actinomycinicus]MBL1085634.1 D-alanyl-D-alanine carboxypeptidase/D-alanyl-D-alanine-endopeptidase [Streptomyces actinomycinicus]
MVRLANAVRPRLARAVTAAGPRVARVTKALRPAHLPRLPRPRTLRTWQYTAGAATAGLALTAGVVTAAGPWDANGQRTAERDRAAALERAGGADHGSGTAAAARRPAPSAAPVLTGLGGTGGAVGTKRAAPDEKALTDVLRPLLDDPALGDTRAAAVVDVATGERLYDTDAGKALTPASTTKIATAVAALSALGPDHRLTTRAVLEPDTGELVLVGGGDPTLTARPEDGGTSRPSEAESGGNWASLRVLATGTAEALRKRGIHKITLSYDTTLYTGPVLHPIGHDENIAPVVALTADEGRTDDSASGTAIRVSDPAADATAKFAAFLKDAGITTTSPGPSKATTRAETLATVSSPPLSTLVERMLTQSDNDIAEALARHTAIASGEPASFDGGAKAIATQLRKLGLPMSGAVFQDGSGLDRDDRLSAGLLTALLVKAGDPAHPGLRPALTGLPVAGFTGTLSTRYADGASGVVRAKTGSLSGVNTLAGTVVDRDGRLLAFAFLAFDATQSRNTDEVRAALDRAATALAGCGCR